MSKKVIVTQPVKAYDSNSLLFSILKELQKDNNMQLKLVMQQSYEDNPIIKSKIDTIGLDNLSFQRISTGLFQSTLEYPVLQEAFSNGKALILCSGWGDDAATPRVLSATIDNNGIICIGEYNGNDTYWHISLFIEILK